MAKIKNFSQTFEVQATAPLDDRIVVNSVDELYEIEYPYTGMAVTVAGSSDLWIFIGEPGEQSNATKWRKVSGNGGSGGSIISKYSLPIMTNEMRNEALNDFESGFTEDNDYIYVDDGRSLEGETTNNTITSINGTYLDIMMRSIRALQAEVARLKNSFEYGIQSYTDENTAMSAVNSRYNTNINDEPLWAIDEGNLSVIPDSEEFNITLDAQHSFKKVSESGEIDSSVEGQLYFKECDAIFSDDNNVLYKLNDSKIILYLVTDSLDITLNLIATNNKEKTKEILVNRFVREGNSVNKYGLMFILSRKKSSSVGEIGKGFNYFYASIINYENNEKIVEGYLKNDGTLGINTGNSSMYIIDDRYTISSIGFSNLNLYRMKFYTKFEDFSEEVISSQPNENDYKYQAAHITIRSVKNDTILERIKTQLQNNEMIWVEDTKTLKIKSNNKIHPIGSINNGGNNNNENNNMTTQELALALQNMGIIVDAQYNNDGEIISLNNIKLNDIEDITFVNNETNNKYVVKVDTEGNLTCKSKPTNTIESQLKSLGTNGGSFGDDVSTGKKNVRGFIAEYLRRISGYTGAEIPNTTSGYNYQSDRLRISSFYAPIDTDTVHGCTHSFIELENSSNVDIPLEGIYLHFYNPYEGKEYHLALDGVIKKGGTYLIRGAKHAEFEDASAFIKVKTFDKEWYVNGKPLSFEQLKVKTEKVEETKDGKTTTVEKVSDDSPVKDPYRFCLTYGIPDLKKDYILVKLNDGTLQDYNTTDYPNFIVDNRFIDGCSYSTFASLCSNYQKNPWCANGSGGSGITIKPNTMFRLMFALDPAKQAFNGFNTKDGSRTRYNKSTDIQILNLDKEYIGYPFSTETIKIDRYTPKASFENRSVMTDKSKLDTEKPNMITCSLGIDVYKTRCFNWISCGVFDEYIWLRKKGDTTWNRFQSYVNVSSQVDQSTNSIHRKEFLPIVNNTVYARMINRFPGDNVLFTAHKCIIEFNDYVTSPTEYEYIVGRADKDGNPDINHTNIDDVYTFTLYPNDYEGRTYQITDQQGFHWIEYQVWAASAEYLDGVIETECNEINKGENKVFPILINTGDMTQSGARINEWLDYYNGGKKMFRHLEQMNCVGNNDLCGANVNDMGTGNDSDKMNSHFFHYFYCFEIPNDEKMIVKEHESVISVKDDVETKKTFENRYIPSIYYFKTKGVFYLICNSEITKDTCEKWFGLYSDTLSGNNKLIVNIYTGIEIVANGKYNKTTTPFTPVYETLYSWLSSEVGNRRVVMACHEMPFTVITKASLAYNNGTQLPYSRNHPTAGNRLGSNLNQLDKSENRGIYWCSRLLEQFGCKIVIGGHKHTYALSYPIKEKYTWSHYKVIGTDTETNKPILEYDAEKTNIDSLEEIKPMLSTLEDEGYKSGIEDSGYIVNWDMLIDADIKEEYNISNDIDNTKVTLHSTKIPYIPKDLFDSVANGIESQLNNLFKCCTPIEVTNNENYNGFVNYSMCQATGYKLKSNKELPSQYQLFSKIIPKTTHKDTGDSPSGEQLYPMYSILEFSGDNNSNLNIKMVRICGIFEADGADKFTQTNYGKKSLKSQYLVLENNGNESKMYGKWVDSPSGHEPYLNISY